MSLTRFDSTIDHRQQEPFSQCCSNATGLSHKYTHLWLKFPFNCHDDAMILYTISNEYNMQLRNSWMKIVGGVHINIFPQNLFPVDSFVIERYHQTVSLFNRYEWVNKISAYQETHFDVAIYAHFWSIFNPIYRIKDNGERHCHIWLGTKLGVSSTCSMPQQSQSFSIIQRQY